MAAPLGNKNGAKQQRLFSDALRRVLTQSPEKIKALAEKLVSLAESGEQWAFREMVDRLDGKPHQSLDVGYSVSRAAEELDDDSLADIAAAGSAGASEQETSAGKPSGVH